MKLLHLSVIAFLLLLPLVSAPTGLQRSPYDADWNMVYLLLFVLLIGVALYLLKSYKLEKWIRHGFIGVLVLSLLTILGGLLLAWGQNWEYGIADISVAYVLFLSFPTSFLAFRLSQAIGPNFITTLIMYLGGIIIWFFLGTFVGWIIGKFKSKK